MVLLMTDAICHIYTIFIYVQIKIFNRGLNIKVAVQGIFISYLHSYEDTCGPPG